LTAKFGTSMSTHPFLVPKKVRRVWLFAN